MATKSRAETMGETRANLIEAARHAFAEKGFAAASMDDFTAAAGLTRGALYHHFGDKKGLLASVVAQIDGEMADKAKEAAKNTKNAWEGLLAQGVAYIELALDPEIQRIVLLDGPAVLGDPSQWPSQSACLEETQQVVSDLMAQSVLKQMDIETAARLLNGAALNAALWVAASKQPKSTLPKAVEAFSYLASGFLAD